MTERVHYLDTMRAVMMVLGIFLHAGLIYSTQGGWLVSDAESSSLITWLTHGIHWFRMPVFFIIAGFFSGFLLTRFSLRHFLTTRFCRLAIPLVATLMTVNILQSWVLSRWQGDGFSITQFWLKENYLQHLWFLVNLLVYTLAAGVVSALASSPLRHVMQSTVNAISGLPLLGILVGLPFCAIAIHGLNKVGFPLYSTILSAVSVYMVMLYIPYFVFGVCLFFSDRLYRKWQSAPALPVALFIVVLAISRTNTPATLMGEAMRIYTEAGIAWGLAALLFTAFARFARHQNRWSQRISEASYTIYLFHHALVVLFGLVLIQWRVPVELKYAVICLLTFLITFYFHEKVLARSQILRWLFSGVWLSRYTAKKQASTQNK